MKSRCPGSFRVLPALLILFFCAQEAFSGVSRAIQDSYRRDYENKALFLKIPVFTERHYVYVGAQAARPAPAPLQARFKVGDQLRVLEVDFGGDEIKFKLAAIGASGTVEVVFKFAASLTDDFPNRASFDRALQETFTEGLRYSDLEEAKRNYVEDQFENAVGNIASASNSNRDFVLKTMAPKLPAYQDALRDIDNLKQRNQELAGQIAQAQSENRRLDADLKTQQSELSRLRSSNLALQEKLEGFSSQLSRMGDELRDARGQTQGYQKELANLQRSLNIKVDANRDLSAQIADLSQTMRKLQQENDTLGTQNTTLRTNLDKMQSENARLSGQNDDLKTSIKQMRDTITTLTSKEDSLARQYIQLKNTKDKLEDLALAVQNLDTRMVEEKVEGGVYSGKVNVYLRNLLLGTLTWRLPKNLSRNQEQNGEANFFSESIDYVRVVPDERNILRSLGERLKLQAKLSAPSGAMEVTPRENEGAQEVGERDQAAWHWRVRNKGAGDARLLLDFQLLNTNSDEIPLFRQEHLVLSASVVRQVRNYLQPIPLGVGAVIGFLLFGIFGIFRRARSSDTVRRRPSSAVPETPSQTQKKL